MSHVLDREAAIGMMHSYYQLPGILILSRYSHIAGCVQSPILLRLELHLLQPSKLCVSGQICSILAHSCYSCHATAFESSGDDEALNELKFVS